MGKNIELSKKIITEDKDGNVLITGKIITGEGDLVDVKNLADKEYVDNAIENAQLNGGDDCGITFDEIGEIENVENNIINRLDEMENFIVDYSFVNVKEMGMKGDGSTDDTAALKKILKNHNNLFFPEGIYIISETIELTNNTNMVGTGIIDNWGVGSNTIIKGIHNNYIFECSWNHQNNFRNLCFDGYGINGLCSSVVEKCSFKGHIGLRNIKTTVVDKCTIANCDIAGIYTMTDCKVLNSFICNNEIGVYLYDSNDNMILCNKIEWNNIGVKCEINVYNLLQNNIIDRNTTYGVLTIDGTYLALKNNKFERNLENHLHLTGHCFSIIGNEFLGKNSEDDQTGELLPRNAIHIKSIQYSMIVNNIVFDCKMFDSVYDGIIQTEINGNVINGVCSTDRWQTLCSDLSINSNQESSSTLSWDTINFLGGNGWDINMKAFMLVVDEDITYTTYNPDHEITVHYSNTGGITYKIKNNTNATHTYRLMVLLDNTRWNKY